MMTGWTALSAALTDESVSLAEFADNRLRFREGVSGIITARFFVPDRPRWQNIRLTYRRPGNNLRLENYVRATLIRINRNTANAEAVVSVSSESDMTDSDQIRSVNNLSPDANKGITLTNFYFYIEVVMRRAVVTEVFERALTLAAGQSNAAYATLETPSVPIPPPSEAEIAGITALANFVGAEEAVFGTLTPSPELIGVELSTDQF